jgi:hypothetical protein
LSRQKSARGASKPAAKPAKTAGRTARATGGGAATRSARGVYVQQAKSDIFVVMLAIALGAILLGCVLLLLVWGRYDYKTSPTALIPPMVSHLATALGLFGG